jgi:hypothetical protein
MRRHRVQDPNRVRRRRQPIHESSHPTGSLDWRPPATTSEAQVDGECQAPITSSRLALTCRYNPARDHDLLVPTADQLHDF